MAAGVAEADNFDGQSHETPSDIDRLVRLLTFAAVVMAVFQFWR